jgi:hypothetical protein
MYRVILPSIRQQKLCYLLSKVHYFLSDKFQGYVYITFPSIIKHEIETGGVAQVVQHILCKHEVLSPNTNTTPTLPQPKKTPHTINYQGIFAHLTLYIAVATNSNETPTTEVKTARHRNIRLLQK